MKSRNASSLLIGISMLMNACWRVYKGFSGLQRQAASQQFLSHGGETDEKSDEGRGDRVEKTV